MAPELITEIISRDAACWRQRLPWSPCSSFQVSRDAERSSHIPLWSLAQHFTGRNISLRKFLSYSLLYIELYSPQKAKKSWLPGPGKVTLFESRVFVADQIKAKSLGWALIQYDVVLLIEKFGQRNRHIHTKGRWWGDTGRMCQEAKECLRLPEAWRWSRKILPQSLQKERTLRAPCLRPSPPELCEDSLLLFVTPSTSLQKP